MAEIESTRVFGARTSRVVGLRRRPLADAYHTLVTGSWTRLVVTYALVWFGTQAVFALAHLLLAAKRIDAGALLASLLAALQAPPEAAPPLSGAWLLNGTITSLEGFVRWLEVGVGAGIIFGKFSLPRARVLWSEVAVVGPAAAGRALMFRMANERTSHIVQAKVAALLIWDEPDEEGHTTRRAHDLALSRGGTVLFTHAWTAVHYLDHDSPLRNESEATLAAREAEIVVTLNGYDEQRLSMIHARHVYPAPRIRWDARFREIVQTDERTGRQTIDYRRFHDVVDVGPTGEQDLPPGVYRRPRRG
ncbi:MAG: potassium transporter [Anaeromyxobacteraceae bacterium]